MKIIRSMGGVKLKEERSSQEFMDLLDFKESLDRLAKAKGVQ